MPLSHLTLVVPDLLWADPDLRREATRELPLPALGWLLGRGQARAQAQSASACLAELFAAPADLPVTAVVAQLPGGIRCVFAKDDVFRRGMGLRQIPGSRFQIFSSHGDKNILGFFEYFHGLFTIRLKGLIT